jgi:hypothetical protein
MIDKIYIARHGEQHAYLSNSLHSRSYSRQASDSIGSAQRGTIIPNSTMNSIDIHSFQEKPDWSAQRPSADGIWRGADSALAILILRDSIYIYIVDPGRGTLPVFFILS